MQVKPLHQGDPAYSAIPSTMHPGMIIQPLSTLHDSKTVSVCGFVKEVRDRAYTHRSRVVSFFLVGAGNIMIACAARRKSILRVERMILG